MNFTSSHKAHFFPSYSGTLIRRIIFFGLIIFDLSFSQSRSVIAGKVISADDALPIIGATVMVANTTIGTATDIQGKFQLKNIPLDRHIILVSAVGYKSFTVKFPENDVPELIIRLTPALIQSQTVVVTANKRAQSLQEIPVSISIIEAGSFQKRNSIALDDALRYVPGVNFQQSQVNIRASSGYSRGVGSRVMMLVDGIPLLTGDTGEITFETIPVFQIEQVEVVKGAGSALYGSGALGGVINVLTKEIGEDPMLWWRVYGGYYSDPIFDQWKWSDKTRYTNGQAIGWSSRFDDLGVAFSIQRLSDDGYREQDWLRRYSGFLKMKYDISSYQSITFSSSLFQQYRGDFLWWKDLANALRPADGQRNVTVSSLRFSNALNYKHFISDEFYFEIKAAHFRGNWRRDSLAIRRLDYSVSDAATTDVQGNILTSRDNMLTIGITGNYERVNADIFGIHYASGTAMYIQDEAAIAENISATAGLRYDIQRVIGLPLQRQTSPKAGIRYSWDEEQTLRASVGLGFRAPSIGELYTTTKNTGSSAIIVPSINLHPEESISYEISSTNALSKYVRLETAIFHSDYNNLIEPNVQSDTVLNAVTINFKNLTEARIQGIEISILTESFHRLLEIDVHYNYNWAVDTKTKSFLRFRPRHIASVNMEYRWNSQTFGMDYRFVSRIEAIDNKLVDLAPIKNGSQRVANHILDIRWIANLAEWSVPVRASLNIKNVLGYNYNELIGNISPPRHFVVSFEGILL